MSIREHDAPKTAGMPYGLRPMLQEDAFAVSEIEREAFPSTWPPTPFRKELQNRLARYLVAYEPVEEDAPPVAPDLAPTPTVMQEPAASQGSLLERLLQGLWPRPGRGWRGDADAGREQPIPGFVGMWFMADEAHITAIAVRGAYRGRGIGGLLLLGSIELATLRRAREVTLEVRVSNDLAQSLYKRYGFEVVGVRKRYYSDDNEDAYIMTTGAIQEPGYRSTLEGVVVEHARRWGASERLLTTPAS